MKSRDKNVGEHCHRAGSIISVKEGKSCEDSARGSKRSFRE